MGETSHTDTGWLKRASQVSGFERATKQLCELAKGISWGLSAGPNVQRPECYVPVT